MKKLCMRCGAELTGDEIALYRKMIFRGVEQFLCLDCLAANLSTPREKLEALIAWFHKTGVCSLFAKTQDDL